MYYEQDVKLILDTYAKLSFNPPVSQYTVAASFYLRSPSLNDPKIISIATGTKCLPNSRYPSYGEALHDSHAEVLARRGAVRWFLEEIMRSESQNTYKSVWIRRTDTDISKYCLKDGVQVFLYISTVPCGDASMRFLAFSQDEAIAALKNSTSFAPLGENEASRGRDNYTRLGVLRTKPGRADSPRTMCMSCSDKIASWNILGFQGALASRFLSPTYLSSIIIGEVATELEEMVREDCERALWKRVVYVIDLPANYKLHTPGISFTTLPFVHSRSAIEATTVPTGSCNEALCWIADSKPYEVFINGLKRGVPPKHRFRVKSRPRISRIALLDLYYQTLTTLGLAPPEEPTTYFEVKRSMTAYRTAREQLMSQRGIFFAWIRSGERWQNFNLHSGNPQSIRE